MGSPRHQTTALPGERGGIPVAQPNLGTYLLLTSSTVTGLKSEKQVEMLTSGVPMEAWATRASANSTTGSTISSGLGTLWETRPEPTQVSERPLKNLGLPCT